MRTTSLQQFIRLRRELTAEHETLQARLRDINAALGDMPLSSASPIQSATGQGVAGAARRGRRTAGGQSLREHVIEVLQRGPMTKEQVLAAVQGRGYRFSTSNPLNSLGVILYGRNPKFNRVDGRFSLGSGVGTTATTSRRAGRRTMSPAARARIAAAQRARWAKQKGSNAQSAASNGRPKRRLSAAARKAIAVAARKR